MTLYFGRPASIQSVASAIPLFGTREFKSPTRSTIAMLSMLMHAPDMFNTIVTELGVPRDHDLFLEYTIRSPKGTGKKSHTDVMLKAGQIALAIEAKWTEPMYETVQAWLKRGKSLKNRKLVLEGWLALLQERVRKNLISDDFCGAIYQMLHRAASAVATGEQPRLAYFLFKPSPSTQSATPEDIKKRLSELWEILGEPEGFRFYIVEIKMSALEGFEALRNLPKDKETSELVSAALQADSPLFEFRGYQVTKIGA